MPQHDVGVLNIVESCHGISNAVYLPLTLIRKFSTSPELAVLILRNPNVMLRELGSLRYDAIGVGQREL